MQFAVRLQHFSTPFATALFLLWMVCTPSLSLAGGIAVLTRDDIVPYNIFSKAFVGSVTRSDAVTSDVRIFLVHGLSDLEQQKIITDIAEFGPSLLLAIGSGAFSFVRTHFSTIPCVCAMVVNPVLLHSAVGTKTACLRMEVTPQAKLTQLRQIMPGVRHVGAVYDPQQCADQVRLLQEAAARLGITVEAWPVSSTKMAMQSFEKIMPRIDALFMFYDKTVLAPQSLQHMFTLSFRYKIPVVGISEKYVRLGALFSLDVDIKDLGRRAWKWSRGCMHNNKPCTGVHYLDARWDLYLNATVAPKMNIAIPPDVLQKAVLIE